MNRQAMFSIGDAAGTSGLTVKTIRYYEEIGLIPKAGRTDGGVHTGGHRVYTEAEVGRLRFIHHARLFGLGLTEIRKLLALTDSKGCPSRQPEYEEILRTRLREIDERINHLLGLRTALQRLVSPKRVMESETCSWNTCSCMEPEKAPSRPQADASANRGRKASPARKT